jgi:hypothetical protein
MSTVKYEMGLYIPEDDILHSHRRENIKSLRSELFFGVTVAIFWK